MRIEAGLVCGFPGSEDPDVEALGILIGVRGGVCEAETSIPP